MKAAVVVLPGSNCDHDCYHTVKHVLGQGAEFIWHEKTELSGFDCIIIPGGFSYGDYLRTGSIARLSPIMSSVTEYAQGGGAVIGICNGFQVLVESGLLPGALIRNASLKFVCKWVDLRLENSGNLFTSEMNEGDVIRVPVAHGEGNYFCTDEDLKELKENGQIVFRYVNEEGEATDESNPNGSIDNIAGISNRQGNVLGMMPHPERCSEPLMGGVDGRAIFESLISNLHQKDKVKTGA